MIGLLRGEFIHKSPASVLIDVKGVGYEVQITLNTYTRIQHLNEGQLYTSLLIREDAHILYGFFEIAEKEMFTQLINVSGIGASTARIMLSYMRPDELIKAIIHGDLRTLESIKGIGKKTAERIILELKDKLSKNITETNIAPMKHNTLHSDALNALLALGINRQAADQAIQKALNHEPDLSLEALIKKALRIL